MLQLAHCEINRLQLRLGNRCGVAHCLSNKLETLDQSPHLPNQVPSLSRSNSCRFQLVPNANPSVGYLGFGAASKGMGDFSVLFALATSGELLPWPHLIPSPLLARGLALLRLRMRLRISWQEGSVKARCSPALSACQTVGAPPGPCHVPVRAGPKK
jgi:hypothetical protein